MPEHIVIIGNGIAGVTAARHIRRISKKKITIVSSESEFFFSRTAMMYVFMGHMKWEHLEPYENWFWQTNDIQLVKGYVQRVNTSSKSISIKDGKTFSYDKLILATGSRPRMLSWEGHQLPGVQTFVSKQDLELLEINARSCSNAVIIGGGLIGVELAEMLTTRNIPVTMLVRESSLWRDVLPDPDSRMISRHVQGKDIKIKYNTLLDKIEGDRRVREIKTTSGEQLPCDLLAIAIGVEPEISFLSGSGIATKSGILVDSYLRTNVEDVFAIGDCAEHKDPAEQRDSVESLWYTSRMMGETVAQTICGKSFAYRPGPWFNSAKFFEIEYQTYGRVAAEPSNSEQHLHWESPDGTKGITVAYDKISHRFLGINSFGIRMRHKVFDSWLRNGRNISFVLQHLEQANFDPEFFQRHEKSIFTDFESALKNDSEPRAFRERH